MPGYFIIYILYDSFAEYNWPFDRVSCHIVVFYPLLVYATPWLLLAISLERARAIFTPFAKRLSSKTVVLSSTIIMICSIAITIKHGLSFKYEIDVSRYVDGTLYVYNRCVSYMSEKDNMIYTFITFSVSIWLPMILIGVVSCCTYMKMKKRAQISKHISSKDYDAQLVQLSRLFTIVTLVFYVCYLPSTIHYTIYVYYRNSQDAFNWDSFNRATFFTELLLFSNSSLNPLIYSKIHLKIFKLLKLPITHCIDNFVCFTVFDVCKKPYAVPHHTDRDNHHLLNHISANCIDVNCPGAIEPCENVEEPSNILQSHFRQDGKIKSYVYETVF